MCYAAIMGNRERIKREITLRRNEWWSAAGEPDETATTLADGERPWTRFVLLARRYLAVDLEGLCAWFDENARYELPLGVTHTFVEPALAHIRNHCCGMGPAPGRVCAAARAIIVAALAVRADRWQELLGKALVKARKDLERIARDLDAAVRQSTDCAGLTAVPVTDGGEVGDALRTVGKFRHDFVHFAAVLENYGLHTIPSREPLRTKKSERPTVVSLDGELLDQRLFDEKAVLQLCIDVSENKSTPSRLLEKRKTCAAEALQLLVLE